jgi:ketosteroid isomerase-like protein
MRSLFSSRAQGREGWVRLALYLRLTGESLANHNILGTVRLSRMTRWHGMRKLSIFVLVILASTLAPCSRAQSLSPAEMRELAKEKEVKQDELVNLEKDMARALQANSGTIFRRIYGDDFVGVLPTGEILDKARWIATVEKSSAKYSSFIATDIQVRMFEETAVVTCLWSALGTKNGHAFSRQSRVTHVYIWGQRGWQAVAGQETLLPG